MVLRVVLGVVTVELVLGLGDNWLLASMLKLLVPGLLDDGDLLLAELEPGLELRALLDALFVHSALLFIGTVLFVKSFLGDVLQLESNLRDLTHVHAASRLARWVVELNVTLDLLFDEVLHRLEVLLVKDLAEKVQDQEALLVGDGAELVRAHHVEHSLDHLLAKSVV